MTNWTEEDRANLGAFLHTQTGQNLLTALKEHSRVRGNLLIEPGIDLKEIASQSHAFAQGQSDIIDTIDALKPKPVTKPLPPPFQPTPPPKPEPESK